MHKSTIPLVTVIMPALNEERNILSAIDDTLLAFQAAGVSGELLVVNDGSSDSTALLVDKKIGECPGTVRMFSHETPQGLGASFWDGVDRARGDFVCMLPGDNENEPYEILRYLPLLADVDMVIPFVFNKYARSRSRNIISALYRTIINGTFGMSLNYTNGTTIFRRSILKELNFRCSGFFYQTDILVRLIKRGYLYAEVPYRLRQRSAGASKAISFKSLTGVIKGYLRLCTDIHIKKTRAGGSLVSDSVSGKRYGSEK